MKYGLKDETIQKIKEAIDTVSPIQKVILYGSRAMGNYRNGSDVDFTLIGNNLDLNNSVYPLMEELEELFLPYTFDISIFSFLSNQEFIDHINRVGIVFYEREKI